MKLDVQDQEFVKLDKAAIDHLIDVHTNKSPRRGTSRRAPRWPFPGHVQFWIKDAVGEELEIQGTCHNLNEHGMGVFCERPFEPGSIVPLAIHQPEATYHGEGIVRHCTPSKGEYFIGIEFSAGD